MFFYLEWIEKRPTIITIINEKPKNITFEVPVNIDGTEVILCGTINNKFTKYYPPCKLPYTKNQYLLSHIQKSIRRMEDIKSVQSAKHLIDLDCQSFLRRLPIIMMEDVTIHESITVVTWLMIAVSKGFEMKYEMVKWLLGIIYYLSNETKKTDYLTNNIEKKEWDVTDRKLNTVLYSLRFRKCYGGMKGDMNMIEYYIHNILSRNIETTTDKIPLVKIEMEDIKKKEWIYQSNDFHCNRHILTKVKRYFPTMTEDKIKQLIWCFSSSLNKRECISYDKKLNNEWELISKVVKRVQKSCIFY
jgi:hypothetical protein